MPNPVKWTVWVSSLQNLKQYQDSNKISLWICKLVEKLPFTKMMGIQLASLTFIMAVVAPKVSTAIASYPVYAQDMVYIDASTLTESTYQWPIARIGLSQRFSQYHQGIDLASPKGSPIYPVTSGNVITVLKNWEGFGNHVIVQHENATKSLYAHLSKITVHEGQFLDRSTKLGEVGSTGRSTGSHLHLEMYQNEVAINPLDALPTLPNNGVALTFPTNTGGK